MSELIEFDDVDQVRALLRAGIELKFELSDDADVFAGSPIYALALNNLREGLVSALLSGPFPHNSQTEAAWYQLSRHRDRWTPLARRAVSHPQWRELDAVELRQWIETLAAPFTVDDLTLRAVKEMADENERRE